MAKSAPMPGLLYGAYPEKRARPVRTEALYNAIDWLQGLALAAVDSLAPVERHRQRQLRSLVKSVRTMQREFTARGASAAGDEWSNWRACLARDGLQSEAALKVMAYVLNVFATQRQLTLRDSQIMTALSILRGELAELATGEGKTLAVSLAALTAALGGVPVHVLTANDYLAKRDADQLRSMCSELGLTVAAIEPNQTREQRRTNYACNVVYCSAKELVFDYLRDRAATMDAAARSPHVLRGLCMAILDEADSVLIDGAITPFILSAARVQPAQATVYAFAAEVAAHLSAGVDYELASGAAVLTPQGRSAISSAAPSQALERQTVLWRIPMYRELLVQQALHARWILERDVHYLVRDGKVELIDANTGRVESGRAWSHGLQQLVELKENCRPSPGTEVMAQITYQSFFPRYLHLSGTSGTLTESRREFLEIYGLRVLRIPSAMASQLEIEPPLLFMHGEHSWRRVVDIIKAHHAAGRPVLIGTDSVNDSERLSRLLADQGLVHKVLNAKQDRFEAELIAVAGERNAITVATNMAGRGTDIAVHASSLALGGLHVICCQQNSARRIDRQLFGRTARQGQTGTAQTILALNEGRLARHTKGLPRYLAKLFAPGPNDALPSPLARTLIYLSQRREERRLRIARHFLQQQEMRARQLHFGHPAT